MTSRTYKELEKERVYKAVNDSVIKAAIAKLQLPLALQPLWLEVATGAIVTQDNRVWFCSERQPFTDAALYTTFDPVPSARLWEIRRRLNWLDIDRTYLTVRYDEIQAALRGLDYPAVLAQATYTIYFNDGHKEVWYLPYDAATTDPFHSFTRYWRAI